MAGPRKTKKRVVFWDTCVFLAWINEERDTCPVDIFRGIEQLVDDLEAGRVTIATSVVTLVEILDLGLTTDQRAKFNRIFNHPNMQMISVDRRVAEVASIIRGHFKKETTVLTPDAIQIAAAHHYRIPELMTMDGLSPDAKRTAMLKLEIETFTSSLKICPPYFIPPLEPLSGPLTKPPNPSGQGVLELVAEGEPDCTEVSSNEQNIPVTDDVSEKPEEPSKDEPIEGSDEETSEIDLALQDDKEGEESSRNESSEVAVDGENTKG